MLINNLEKPISTVYFTVENALKVFNVFRLKAFRAERREIEELKKQLESLPDVKKVREVERKNKNSHEVLLQIVSDLESDSRTMLVKTAISLAVKTERKLDSIFKVDDWDIGVRVVKNFEDIYS